MCNQAVSLISAELERRGIATVCIILLREVAERVHPPRALCVPYAHGFPLGAPHDAMKQKQVMRAAFELLALDGPRPLLRDYSD
jgi:D-proline reductase (dithiol) PrdB